MGRRLGGIAGLLVLTALLAGSVGVAARSSAATSPINHVVVIFQENHTFDNVLGRFCQDVATGAIVRPGASMGCSYATSGRASSGATIPLAAAPDVVPDISHAPGDQQKAVDGGLMDGFDTVQGCDQTTGYACYTAFDPSAIPNLAALAQSFAVEDATFESDRSASWISHLELASSLSDGFTGDNPTVSGKWSWGCDTKKTGLWVPAGGGTATRQPSCVPDYTLDPTKFPYGGAFAATAVPHIPTIMDRLDAAGLGWRLYAAGGYGSSSSDPGYVWGVCPTFAECLYKHRNGQYLKFVPAANVVTDAQAGSLPSVSWVIPVWTNSQHNKVSMLQGDNWIGQVVQAVESGPDWSSTAIFITYDDCGCFYDHVPPPPGAGLRIPMVIVSPYARAGYTDSTTASLNGVLAFIEHTFGVQPLSANDANAYDFSNSFDYSQSPLPPVQMGQHAIPASEQRFIAEHPVDEGDPT